MARRTRREPAVHNPLSRTPSLPLAKETTAPKPLALASVGRPRGGLRVATGVRAGDLASDILSGMLSGAGGGGCPPSGAGGNKAQVCDPSWAVMQPYIRG